MVVFTLITNRERDAEVALDAGIQRIAIDLEAFTKRPRQAGCGTFIAGHSHEDMERMRSRFPEAEMLVRVNSIHSGSPEEMKRVADSGPQFVMLPFFTSMAEVDAFLDMLPKQSMPVLLLESAMSLHLLERLIGEYPVREYFVGLNDLSLDLGNRNFLVTLEEPLFVEAAERLRASGLPWGLGGVGDPFDSRLPISTQDFFRFQIAMGSSRALFSRNFRILFDQPDPVNAVGTAYGELCRLAETTAHLPSDSRHDLCRQFLRDQAKNWSLEFYPPRERQVFPR